MTVVLPLTVFQYMPASIHALTNLANTKIWLSDPFEFNDPFDCALSFFAPKLSDELEKKIRNGSIGRARARGPEGYIEQDEEEVEWTIGAQAKIMSWLIEDAAAVWRGVSCFCGPSAHEMLMWGHYADHHRGLRLEFDTSKAPFNELQEVKYRREVPSADDFNIGDHGFELVRSALLMKSKSWKYENEYRLIRPTPKIHVDYPADALKAICVGARLNADVTRLITKISPDVPIYRASLDSREFQMEYAPLRTAERSP